MQHNWRMPSQPDLFGADAGAPGQPAGGLVRIAGPVAQLSKAQKDFNRLSERIAQLRAHLGQWQVATDTCHRRAVTDLVPLQSRLHGLQREAVLWIDNHLVQPPQAERLPKKLRAKLTAMLRMLAEAVLQQADDAEVEAAHDRHSPHTRRAAQQEQADLAAAVLGQAMGDHSLFDGETASVDDLLQRASQRQRAAAEAEAETSTATEERGGATGTRPGRDDKARARNAKALQEASQSVREVYRRLASSLHPDREPDAVERARKTSLMAQVNDAYARNDLLALLTVQMDIEQITPAHLAAVSDSRLHHYSRVLKAQKQALEHELADLQMPVAQFRDDQPGLLSWPALLLTQALQDDIDRVRQATRALIDDGALLRDPRTRLAFLRHLQVGDPDDTADPYEELLLMQALDEIFAQTPRKTGRRRR